MAQTSINIRIDENVKTQAEDLFHELGLNMSTAFNIFIRQAIIQRKIPFEIAAPADPFYNEENMRWLKESIKQADEGKFVVKSTEELLSMEK
jgi:DNA-damage-inducible protein J